MPRTSTQLDAFFREVAYERGEGTNSAGEKGGSEDETDEPPPNMPKVASYKEATSGLQDVLHFLETEGNKKIANEGKKDTKSNKK